MKSYFIKQSISLLGIMTIQSVSTIKAMKRVSKLSPKSLLNRVGINTSATMNVQCCHLQSSNSNTLSRHLHLKATSPSKTHYHFRSSCQSTLSTFQLNRIMPTHGRDPLALEARRKSTLSYADILEKEDGQLNPLSLMPDGRIPMPKALSPSAALEFKKCPQSYLFQYLFSIKQPPNLALAKGSVCHSALEEVYDLEPNDRTLEHLQNLFRKNWSQVRLSEMYGPLFEIISKNKNDCNDDDKEIIQRDIEAERKWGNEALQLLENYFQLEDPRLIPRPNPLEREIWVTAHLNLDPRKGATSANKNISIEEGPDTSISTYSDSDSNSEEEEEESKDTFYVRGIVDRLDYVAIPPSPNYPDQASNNNDSGGVGGAIRIVDYKTGKAPDFKYSPTTNQRIAEENMFQLKIYALLLREMIDKKKAYSKSGNLQKIDAEDIRLLRLLYLTSVNGEAQYLDMDLGQTQDERDTVLQDVHQELANIWISIKELVKTQDPREFAHCDREWCICHKLRPKFVPGSLS